MSRRVDNARGVCAGDFEHRESTNPGTLKSVRNGRGCRKSCLAVGLVDRRRGTAELRVEESGLSAYSRLDRRHSVHCAESTSADHYLVSTLERVRERKKRTSASLGREVKSGMPP